MARRGCRHSRRRSQRGGASSSAHELPGGLLASRSRRAARRRHGRRAQALRPVGPHGRRDRVPARLGRGPGAGAARGRRGARRDPARAHRPGHVPTTDADAESVAALLAALHVPDGLGLRPSTSPYPTARPCRARRPRVGAAPRLGANGCAPLQEERRAAVIVHGDFDERNLLPARARGLCAIDPLPCAGDGTYDAAYWVHANRRPRQARAVRRHAPRSGPRAGPAARLVRRHRGARLSRRCKTPGVNDHLRLYSDLAGWFHLPHLAATDYVEEAAR